MVNLWTKAKHAWSRLLNLQPDIDTGYPIAVQIGDRVFDAEAVTLILGPEKAVVGVMWATRNGGMFEHHSNGFTIWNNPKFQHIEPGVIPTRNYDAPIYN